jgi:hypothetical protein
MVLLKGERAQAALEAANRAVERGEVISVRLSQSLSLLRERRNELAQKMRSDTAAALTHQRADLQTAVAVPPAPPRRVWSYS